MPRVGRPTSGSTALNPKRTTAWIGVILGVVLGAGLIPIIVYAADTPSLGNGDCWRSGTPKTCRLTWQGRSTFIYFRAIDQFSSQRPG